MANKGRIVELEAALEREKNERAEADERARRANERAREADEAYRKLQLDLVGAKDEAASARDQASRLAEKLTESEAELAAARERRNMPPPLPGPVIREMESEASPQAGQDLDEVLARFDGLRELLTGAAMDLSELHADEVALGEKRGRILSDACALLARAVGAKGEAPPPLPSRALEARLSLAPVVDISEIADLIESLRPPRPPTEQ